MRLLTEKQIKVLSSINRFGVISSTQLIDFLKRDLSHVTVYTAKEKLLKLGLINQEKIGRVLVLYIKPSGVEYLGSALTAFTKINFSLLQHQLIMNDCILLLKQLAERKGELFRFITERELRSEYLEQNFNQAQRQNPTLLKKVADRIPDFIVQSEDGEIAYEVEMTRKSSKRYFDKMTRYKDEILSGRYRQVRYLCETDNIRQAVTEQAQKAGVDGHMLQIDMIRRLRAIGEKQ